METFLGNYSSLGPNLLAFLKISTDFNVGLGGAWVVRL